MFKHKLTTETKNRSKDATSSWERWVLPGKANERKGRGP